MIEFVSSQSKSCQDSLELMAMIRSLLNQWIGSIRGESRFGGEEKEEFLVNSKKRLKKGDTFGVF